MDSINRENLYKSFDYTDKKIKKFEECLKQYKELDRSNINTEEIKDLFFDLNEYSRELSICFGNFEFYITGELIKIERHHYSNTDKDGDDLYVF